MKTIKISRLATWLAGCGVLTLGILAMQAQQVAAPPKPSSNFTGKVTRLTEGNEGAIAHIRFEPGSRTRWHSHGAGQIILVEEGVGLVQERGGPVIELHAGETLFAKPGVTHWHGAAPKEGGVQYNVTRGEITWMEEVSDQDFNAPTQRLR